MIITLRVNDNRLAPNDDRLAPNDDPLRGMSNGGGYVFEYA